MDIGQDFCQQANRTLLCLKCRGIGHGISSCPQPDFLTDGDGLEWFQSDLQERFRSQVVADQTPETVCQRCISLDLPSWLNSTLDVTEIEELSDACEGRYKHNGLDTDSSTARHIFRELGVVDALRFYSNCNLCVCLFDLIPNPRSSSQTVTLAIAWTYFRLEHHIAVDTDERRKSSRFVTAILEPPLPGEEVHRTMTIEGDGLVIDQATCKRHQLTLGSASVGATKADIDMLQTWIRLCMYKHPVHCRRPGSSKLHRIRLIDAVTRTLVPYSRESRDYLTLSYVWGGVDQCFAGAGRIGAKLPAPLPQTLDDAMSFTLQLGKRYIWIDSICIDQSDAEDKKAQIDIMSDIYRNSFASVVALDARDANGGLPRVSYNSTVPQMSCSIDGTILRTVGPTLERVLYEAHWRHRAWTYQEAILSPRCIYISRHGLYFECNSMHCCESLDVTSSPAHNEVKGAESHPGETYTISLNLGMLRNPATRAITDRSRALNIYSILASEYGRRQITHLSDRLAAFSGILHALEENAYQDGFLWGLPLAHLNWAMVWQAYYPDVARNPHFPSWSWLSNIGGIWPGAPSLGRLGVAPDSCPFDISLAVYHPSSYTMRKTVFKQSYRDLPDEHRESLVGDPLLEAFRGEKHGDFHLPPSLNDVQRCSVLFFDSFAFRFAIAKRWEDEGNTYHSLVIVEAAGQEIRGITTYDPESQWANQGAQLWLLLTRHVEEDRTLHNFILLRHRDGVYERADMLRLEVPNERIGLLTELSPHRLRGALI